MLENSLVELSPSDVKWGHNNFVTKEGINIHYIRQGKGQPVLLLHGWPGFWYDWRKVVPILANEADVIAPDFRGYGDSDKPDFTPAEGYTPQVLAADLIQLVEELNLDQITLVAHDIGATVAQTLVKLIPEKIKALVLLNPPYPGIGARRFDPTIQGQFWYQHLHNLPWAEDLIGYDKNTVRIYLNHFYNHWVGRKDALTDYEFEQIVDYYSRPGAFKASIAYYRARANARTKEANTDSASLQINLPTTVLWGDYDPVMIYEWSDRINEYFPNAEVKILNGIGHFVVFEDPMSVIDAIKGHL